MAPHHPGGGLPEWSNGAVLKTAEALPGLPGFESLTLRQARGGCAAWRLASGQGFGRRAGARAAGSGCARASRAALPLDVRIPDHFVMCGRGGHGVEGGALGARNGQSAAAERNQARHSGSSLRRVGGALGPRFGCREFVVPASAQCRSLGAAARGEQRRTPLERDDRHERRRRDRLQPGAQAPGIPPISSSKG